MTKLFSIAYRFANGNIQILLPSVYIMEACSAYSKMVSLSRSLNELRSCLYIALKDCLKDCKF